MNGKILSIIVGVILLGVGLIGGWTAKGIFTGNDSKITTNSNAASSEPLSDNTADVAQAISNTEDYYKNFTARGKITSINDSEIQISISNIDVPETTDLSPNDSGKRKILLTDQTEIAAQPENTMGDPAPMGGTNSAPSDTDKKDFKIIAIKDLAKDDIIFVMTIEDVSKTNDLTAVKIVKEHKNAMTPAPITP